MHIVLQIVWFVFSAMGAVFIGWFCWHGVKNSEDPAKVIFKIIFSAVLIVSEVFFLRYLLSGDPSAAAFVIVGSVALCGIVLSLVWTPQISDFLISPLTDMFDGGKEPPEPKPFYSVALARRKHGEFSAAIVAVREQLAKFPNDYEGILLLATIQAEDTKDLPSAEITLNRFCESENAPPRQIAAALTQLADWHLKIANDVDSARGILQRIIEKFPGTEFSTAAAQRIAHLGGTEKILLSAHDRQPMFVPESVKSAGLRDTMQDLVPEEADPKKLVADYVKHLQEHPLDIEAREKLAIIYARHLQRLDFAANELQQLIDQPGQSPKRIAHWLNLFADLQIRAGADYETIAPTLEKIIGQFPDLPVADLARSRLNYLKLEIKGQKAAPENKKLDEYEQNIGLKYGPAYGSPRHL